MSYLRFVTGFAAFCITGAFFGAATPAKAGLAFQPTGIFAHYYDGYWDGDSGFFSSATPAFTRNDPSISFSDAQYNHDYSPSKNPWDFVGTPLADEETFSVHWKGFLQVDTADTYDFRTLSDDGIMVKISNTAVISNPYHHPPSYDEGPIFLTAGLHPIEVFYGEQFIHSVAHLEWKGASASSFSMLEAGTLLKAVPGPLPLLGVGATFRFSRKLRLRQQRQKILLG